MKENKYDDPAFFEKYSQMSRSTQGLDGAGEWQALRQLLPDFRDKRVLDLGCGYGWHCIYAAQGGARQVLGVDLSHKMLEVARQKTDFPQVEYRRGAMEDLDFQPDSFDVILSSLAFHYVADFKTLAQRMYRWLAPGGRLVFSAEHPVFTAEGSQNWTCDEAGNILHFPVDNYYYEGRREALFLGERVVKYHKTLTTYLDGLLTAGFTLERLVEPMPPEEMRSLPGMLDEMRRPMMLLVAARK